MEAQELKRGRLIDHIQLVVPDLERSKRFYSAVFEALGVPIAGGAEDFFWADEFVVSSKESKAAQGKLTGPTHVAFQAQSKQMVEAVYKAGLAAGGTDNGAPGIRPYHPGYYAAFVLDPDQNNIEFVYHGPHDRSTPAVTIKFEM